MVQLRPLRAADLPALLELTIETFAPFHEQSFRQAVGDVIYRHVYGSWREDRRRAMLCEHAFSDMKARGVELVTVGTGGDDFHVPARALYERLGCTPFPLTTYYRAL